MQSEQRIYYPVANDSSLSLSGSGDIHTKARRKMFAQAFSLRHASHKNCSEAKFRLEHITAIFSACWEERADFIRVPTARHCECHGRVTSRGIAAIPQRQRISLQLKMEIDNIYAHL